MTNVIKVIIAIGIISLASLLQNLLNTKKEKRARQPLLIIISFIYAIAMVCVFFTSFEDTYKWCELHEFLNNGNFFIVNTILLLGFILIKIVFCPIVTGLWHSRKLVEFSSGLFYEYDADYNSWFLKEKWTNFRKYFFAMVCGATLVTGLFAGLTWLLGQESSLWIMTFPAAALVVINELYSFINGKTKDEFMNDVSADESVARKISNFYKLRAVFEHLLPEPILSSHSGYEFARTESTVDVLKQMSAENDRESKVIANYFLSKDRYKEADVDGIQATANMMHRKNVVFFNPFYRELEKYIMLPLINTLLNGKKCVVVAGRMSTCEDIKKWLNEKISEYSHIDSLWRTGILSYKETDCNVGIISFPQLYDYKILSENKSFFNETDFVLLVEPSLIVNTGQIALSIIAEEMHCNDEKPVYCVCDRNVDGLVDTISHLLHTEFTDVVAPPVPRCLYTAMAWDADGDFIRQNLFDKQTRYLGNGIELSAIAVKNQIPKVSWYAETKVPIRDIKWIAGQYFATLCRHMNLPAQQNALYEKIKFVPSLWSVDSNKDDEQFIIAEDEFCNMFSAMRTYLSRGKVQSFVNIMSENYLLRDYMRCNQQMFISNPDAVPSIVADYAKTERNTLIKLIILMTFRPVTEKEIIDEFHLVGIETDDAFAILSQMLKKYTYADDSIFTVNTIKEDTDELSTVSVCSFTVPPEDFEKHFAKSLKSAYFIVEEEKQNEEYIDAKMFSHITQLVLPGQFVTYNGKYYLVKHISPQSGVVLRRASDLYDGRKYYRQVRNYVFDSVENDEITSIRRVMDIEIAFVRKDFSVNTTGYLELNDNHDLRLARLVDLSDDTVVANLERKYRNKSVLRIKFPELTSKMRFTLCLVMSEIFKTLFPDGWQYLSVVTKQPEDVEGMLNYVVYPVVGEVDEEYIYIVEDSDIDLGLLQAVERNLMKIMEIVTDFLEWHYEKMREPEMKDPVPGNVNLPKAEAEKHKKRVALLDRIRRLFGIKKEEDVVIEDPTEEKSPQVEEVSPKFENDEVDEIVDESTKKDCDYELTENDSALVENNGAAPINTNEDLVIDGTEEKDEQTVVEPVSKEKQKYCEDDFLPDDSENPELTHVDGTDIFDTQESSDDDYLLEEQFKLIGITPLTQTRYQEHCYLKFGFKEIDNRIQTEELRKYLRVHGFSNNALTKARKRDVFKYTELDLKAENRCDFCSTPLTGVSYEKLNDGRVRCNDCSSTAITTEEEFKELFQGIFEMMKNTFGIDFKVPISVRMADANTVAKGAGSIFRPSNDVALRVLGYAKKDKGKYSVIIENGSPRLATIDTMVHELTHIWQYLNWKDAEIIELYGENNRLLVYEGMAMWAAVQYLYQSGETYYASLQEFLAADRDDVYGAGFRFYREKYPFVKDFSVLKYSPFTTFPPL